MKIIYCPVCEKRICDSDKKLTVTKASENDTANADLVIKCRNCKNQLAIRIQ